MATTNRGDGATLTPTVRSEHPMSNAPPSPARPTFGRALLAGLAAGAIAGLIAAVVQLPLESPDDVFFNSASVVLGALVAGLAGGALWHLLKTRGAPVGLFAGCVAVAFVLIGAAALLLDSVLSGLPGYVIPLAAIVLGGVALLTPLFAQPAPRAPLVAPVATVAALAVGFALAGQGDAESGRLALSDAPAGQGTGAVLRPADVAGMTFAIAPGESTVTYTVREKLAQLPAPSDAVGKTSQVSGTLFLDGRPSTVTVDVSTFQSDQAMRDNFIRTNPNGPQFSRFPEAQLVVTDLDLPTEYREGETITRTVTGNMTIRGVTRPQTFTVQARLAGGTLEVHAITEFAWTDYQIPKPNFAGFVEVQDTARIEALLIARGSR